MADVSISKLVGMDWKLGVALTSDSCKNLNSPFVVLKLKIADSSGKITTKALEMSLPEFQNFSKQMTDIASLMETV